MGLNPDQAAAEAAFAEFKQDPDAVVFALLGYAGTGKSFTEAHLIKNHILDTTESIDGDRGFFTSGARTETLISAPTHKAMNIGRRFLTEAGIKHEIGYDRFNHSFGTPITGTTAQLIGIRPVITDDQTSKQLNFGKVDGGLISKLGRIGWIVIDEVSMLSWPHLKQLIEMAKDNSCKILVVGDPGQLPPVEAEAIDFSQLEHCQVLNQIMRQTGDSAIPHLAKAIREERDWRQVSGAGVDHFENPAGAFIDEVEEPSADERDRSVFIAYRNAQVNAVQQAACMKVYGHGRLEVRTGEIVTANTPLMMAGSRIPVIACNNGDVLRIVGEHGDGEWGKIVEAERLSTGKTFTTEYLDEKQMGDPNHPYNIELKIRGDKARALQSEFNRGDKSVDAERRSAWARFFELKNSTIMSASHPFAITSHKSQGSTYRQAFVDAADMAPFDRRSLYVGVTRPSEELVIG